MDVVIGMLGILRVSCVPKAHWLSVPRFIYGGNCLKFSPTTQSKLFHGKYSGNSLYSLTAGWQKEIFSNLPKSELKFVVIGSCTKIWKKLCFFYIFNASIKIWKAHTNRGFIYLAKEVRRRSGGGPVSVEVTVQGGVPGGEWLARLAGLAPGLAVGGEGGAPRGVHWHWEGPLQLKLWSRVFSSWQECFLPAINLVNNLS